MRIFTFVSALALLGIGAASYYGWEGRGWDGPALSSAVPAFVGAAMLLGTLLALALRRTGLWIAFLAALAGAGLGAGRLLPDYMKEAFDPSDSFTRLLLAMVAVCLIHVLVSAASFVFRPRPTKRSGRRKQGAEAVEATG